MEIFPSPLLVDHTPRRANPFEWALLACYEAEAWNHRKTQHQRCKTALLVETYTRGMSSIITTISLRNLRRNRNHRPNPHQPVYQQVQPPQQQVQTVYRPMVQTVTSSMGNDDELFIAYLIWLFLGIIGGHRFYFGHIGLGLLYLFTAGLFGIGWFVDLFLISDLVRESQRKKAMMLGAGPMYAQR
jgi:TM2 domain-containing membrane protein YozV